MSDKIQILIVDDEEKARLYLATILADLYPEFQISLAGSPMEALFLLRKQRFDIAFFDVEMQGSTGLDMLYKLQEEKTQIPVIFVSAYKKAEFIQYALRLKAIDYLDKPVDPYELKTAVQKALSEANKNTVSGLGLNQFCLLTDVGERFVEKDEIAYIKAENRYSRAYFIDGTSNIVRSNLVHLMENLPQSNFLHVGRKYIANVKYIKFVSRGNKSLTLVYNNERIVIDTIFPEVLVKLLSEFQTIKLSERGKYT